MLLMVNKIRYKFIFNINIGFIWILKDIVYPDKGFQEKVDIVIGSSIGAMLVGYWWMGNYSLNSHIFI